MLKPNPSARQTRRPRYTRASMVVFAMRRDGLCLTLEYRKGSGGCWGLSDGSPVPNKVALEVIRDGRIAGCGDALFDGAASQVYRYAGDGER
jgi:hypothetical protein